MAYDRYDTRDAPRDERSRWSDDRHSDQGRNRDERGFFERAGDEVASWFGDEDAERRRREDQMRDRREGGWNRDREENRDWDRERMSRDRDFGRDRDRERNRDFYQTRGLNERGGFSESDYNPSWRRELSGGYERDRDFGRNYGSDRGRDYRPMTGDYGRSSGRGSDQLFAGGGHGQAGEGGWERGRSSEWQSDPYRSTSRAGTSDRSDRSRHEDPNYDSWRRRHMSELDRDYDDYRREHQSRFENDFSSWRDRRQQKRGLLGQIREHMEIVGNDDQHVGTVDKVAGDRIILTKSDPESGGAHHSLMCSHIEKVEGDRVILDCSAEQARRDWRDESRGRALFEREDQGEMGPGMLDRSFPGTYR
jgi:hypothetical protein